MRDTIKDKGYFDQSIELKNRLVKGNLDKLENGLIKEDRIASVKTNTIKLLINTIKAKYSRGDDMRTAEVQELYAQTIRLVYENWKEGAGKYTYVEKGESITLDQYTVSTYFGILELISLGILLNVPDEIFEKLIAHVERDQIQDFLIEFLFSYRQIHREPLVNENYQVVFHINERYARLKKVIAEKNREIAEQELNLFLKKEWYPSFKGTPLYNQHKNVHNTYVGYWCFIVAAIVKIKELDDSLFRDNEYYPKDLLLK